VGKGEGRGAASHVVQRRFLGMAKWQRWDGELPHKRWTLTRMPPRAHPDHNFQLAARHNTKGQ
jgi:hypothetical protein